MFKKMSFLFALTLTAWTSIAHAEFSGTEPSSAVGPVSHIIPFASYYEKADLPPRLVATFHVDCSELFQGVVRHDQYDPQSQTVIIFLGGQTRSLKTGCSGSTRKVEVDAGPTYSGRRFQIRQILPAPKPRG